MSHASMAAKTVAITQSNYIPWKGYFDLINSADECILLDSVQYTRRDWRNRNRIKTPDGARWLSIPVEVKGKYLQKTEDVVVSDARWAERHWQSIRHNYAKAEHFGAYERFFEDLYLGTRETRLSAVNHRFITALCGVLGITSRISWSHDYHVEDGRTERLVGLARQAGATRYLSGPAARAYLDEPLFEAAGIEVRYMDYSGYSEYPQLFPPFEHGVTVVDLVLNTGSAAGTFMKSLHR